VVPFTETAWTCSENGRGEITKKFMKSSPPGRRKRGRPKLTWEQGIRGLMGEKRLIEEDGKDREKWKKR